MDLSLKNGKFPTSYQTNSKMKRTLVSILIFCNTFGAVAQTNDSSFDEINNRNTGQNEISLNVLNVIIFGALEGAYERILSDNSSLGIEVFAKAFNKNEGEDVDLSEVYSKDFSVTSKFKYFIKEDKRASGFYAEAFGMVSDGINEKEVDRIDPLTGEMRSVEEDREYTDFALGFGIGGKFVAKQGFLMDVSFGLGRNLFHKDSPDIVILPTASVGYRF